MITTQLATATPRVVPSKRVMYDLLYRGAFGNTLRSWATREALSESGYAGPVTMRYAGRSGGGFAAYGVPQDALDAQTAEWVQRGADARLVRFNESAPDDALTIQGEVARHDQLGPLYMRYSTLKLPMRAALKTALPAFGLSTRLLLERFLSPSSLADLYAVLEWFPDSVVEFSAFSRCVGHIPSRNTVVWEVRNY